jgi:hypothetical protein
LQKVQSFELEQFAKLCTIKKKKKEKEKKNFLSFANLLPYEPKTSGDIVQKQIQPS